MDILWLSWRDLKNPKAGGAEKLAFEVSTRFVKNGHDVTLFTSRFPHSKKEEVQKGIKIVRSGNQITCRIHAFLFYLKNKNFDIVIDEINTLPFFTPLYTSKTIVLIHQLAKEYWYTEISKPLGTLGYLMEELYLKLYAKKPTITVSKSTKKDLAKIGFQNIQIVKEGLDIKPSLFLEKEELILFLGRLTRAKAPDDAIKAFGIVHAKYPTYKMVIAGRGGKAYIQKLKRLASDLKLTKSIVFAGFVSEKEKLSLLKKSLVVLIPSAREGWNLVATEANALSTIPVAYNVPGLRDSIKNNFNGLLTAPGAYKQLAQKTIEVIENPNLASTIRRNGFTWSKNFSWNNTATEFMSQLAASSK